MNSDPYPTQNNSATRGFLVDMYHRYRNGATEFYGIGRLETGESFGIIDDRQVPRFFIRNSDRAQAEPLIRGAACRESGFSTMDTEPVYSVEAPQQQKLRRLAESLASRGIRTYEADINFSHQYLMDHEISGSLSITGDWRPSEYLGRVYHNPQVGPAEWNPNLSILALDMETNVETGAILGISLVLYFTGAGEEQERMFMVGEPRTDDPDYLTCCATEQKMLHECLAAVRTMDPDILTGWNVIDFDLRVLRERLAKYKEPFLLSRSRDPVSHHIRRGDNRAVFTIPGRQVLDCMQLLRWGSYRFDDFRLDTVAHELLGRNKVLQFDGEESKPDQIIRLYHEDRKVFCDYCLEDSP